MTRRVTISVSAVDPALLRRQVGRLAEAEAQVTLERQRPTWSRQKNDVSYRVVEHGAGEP